MKKSKLRRLHDELRLVRYKEVMDLKNHHWSYKLLQCKLTKTYSLDHLFVKLKNTSVRVNEILRKISYELFFQISLKHFDVSPYVVAQNHVDSLYEQVVNAFNRATLALSEDRYDEYVNVVEETGHLILQIEECIFSVSFKEDS